MNGDPRSAVVGHPEEAGSQRPPGDQPAQEPSVACRDDGGVDESDLCELSIAPDGRVYAFGLTSKLMDVLERLTQRPNEADLAEKGER